VPTVRSCVAALLVLAGIALGREAISIRLIATGALIVLAFRPEALAGPSFQMSFVAVTAIVALHSTRWRAVSFSDATKASLREQRAPCSGSSRPGSRSRSR
jgi:predicted membrane metal-binding protein